jgi:hypothetical protein
VQRRITGRPLCRNQYKSSVGSGPQSSYEYSDVSLIRVVRRSHLGASGRSRAASPLWFSTHDHSPGTATKYPVS